MQQPAPTAPANAKTAKVWDLPTRLFHWLLVILVVAMVGTGLTGKLEQHMVIGQALLALLLFRLIWGFVGNRQARFTDFLAGPGAALAYLRGLIGGGNKPGHGGGYVGHNPVGGYAVFAMLGLLLLQAVSGLFTSDDFVYDGPLYSLVPSSVGAQMSSIHRITIDAIYIVVGIHLLATLFYLLVKRENLVKPMVTGDKQLPAEQAAAITASAQGPGNLVAAILFALCLAVVFGGIALLR